MRAFPPGTTIDIAAALLAAEAGRTNRILLGVFNETPLIAFPTIEPQEIVNRYYEARPNGKHRAKS